MTLAAVYVTLRRELIANRDEVKKVGVGSPPTSGRPGLLASRKTRLYGRVGFLGVSRLGASACLRRWRCADIDMPTTAGEDKTSFAMKVARFVAWAGGLVLAWLVFQWIRAAIEVPLLRNSDASFPWGSLAILAAIPILALILLRLYGRATSSDVVIPVLAISGFVLITFYFSIKSDRDSITPEPFDYCSYSANTFSEVEACLRYTTPGVAEFSDSPAGRFARGDGGCGPDAGRLCAAAKQDQQFRQDYRDFQNNPVP